MCLYTYLKCVSVFRCVYRYIIWNVLYYGIVFKGLWLYSTWIYISYCTFKKTQTSMFSFLLWYVNSRSRNIHWLIDRTNIYPVKNIGFSPERLFHECGIRARKQNSFYWLKETKGLISSLNKNYNFISLLMASKRYFCQPIKEIYFHDHLLF